MKQKKTGNPGNDSKKVLRSALLYHSAYSRVAAFVTVVVMMLLLSVMPDFIRTG